MKLTLAQVLNITTGRLLSKMEDVYIALDFLTGDNLMTHQLPRAMGETREALLAQLPADVAAINLDDADITPENVQQVVSDLVAKHGNEFEVQPVATYQSQNPITELLGMMRPDQSLITVLPPDAEPTK